MHGVQCDTDEHHHAKMLAAIAILVYPVGIFCTNATLLFLARKAICSGNSTTLSRALSFLHRDFEPRIFWWELVEMLRRFLLVGVFVVIKQGSVEQLAYAMLVTLVYLPIQVTAAPFRNKSDDFVATTCSLALAALFALCLLFLVLFY